MRLAWESGREGKGKSAARPRKVEPREKKYSHVMGVYRVQGLPRVNIIKSLSSSKIIFGIDIYKIIVHCYFIIHNNVSIDQLCL